MEGKLLRVLAIETSCDETSASVVEGVDFPEIKTNIIASQIDIHKITGGVVPEVAARAHCEQIIPVIEQSLAPLEIKLFGKRSNQTIHKVLPRIDAIAVTVGPGLVGSLLVGVETAKALAFASGKPLIPVNHLEGHIFAAFYENVRKFQKTNSKKQINFNIQSQIPKHRDDLENYDLDIICNLELGICDLLPALALVVSGGHTELVLIKDMFDYEIIGQTLDDAAGEAFDKVASLLNLPYPGGPEIAKIAGNVIKANLKEVNNYELLINNYKFKLPRPMLHSGDLNFSFSGLKTAVVNLVKSDGISSGVAGSTLPRWRRSEIAYEFQEAVVETLLEKMTKALQMYNSELIINNSKKKIINYKLLTINSVLLTGGVSANKRLREAFQERFGDKLFISPFELTGDNAGMIGLAAFYRYKKQITNYKYQITNKLHTKNSKPIHKSKTLPTGRQVLNLKSHFPWQGVDVDPNLEL